MEGSVDAALGGAIEIDELGVDERAEVVHEARREPFAATEDTPQSGASLKPRLGEDEAKQRRDQLQNGDAVL